MQFQALGSSYNVEVYTAGGLPPHVVSQVFAPEGIEQAPDDTIIIEIKNTPGKNGYWGLIFDKVALQERDLLFQTGWTYLARLIESGRVIIDFMQDPDVQFEVVGTKDSLEGPDDSRVKHKQLAKRSQ
ncbi:hypothetical protein ACFL1U_03120 [Patescibacteria group bacterium]